MKLCKRCKEVPVKFGAIFCEDCRKIERHKTCPVCNREFDAKTEKAKYCYRDDCPSSKFANSKAVKSAWVRAGVVKEKHHTWGRKSIGTGNKCQLCGHEIKTIIDQDGIVLFNGRFKLHCSGCDSLWQERAESFNEDFLYVC